MTDKKPNAIYQPGELARVRGKLGPIDEAEAKRMAQVLGGEVGTERSAEPARRTSGQVSRRKTVEMAVPGRPNRRHGRMVELAPEDEYFGSKATAALKAAENDPADDPAIVLKTSYMERVKMDRYASQFDFEIKNSLQVLTSMFSFVGEPVDYVNPRFVSRRMNVYYQKIEQLVNSTRALLPRNNARRSERLKKSSPFVFAILDTIRYWNMERIGTDLSKIQSHPRSVRISEMADILRSIYKPLFVLEKLDMDIHIKGSYKLLYKLLYMENPAESKDKNQELIRCALASFADIRREVHFGLYPLLMKLISDRWFPYEKLFTHRRRRFMSFIGATEAEQILPLVLSPEQAESGDLEAVQEDINKEKEEAGEEVPKVEEDPNDPEVIERKAREAAEAAEKKALDHGLSVLEKLYPQAGWDKLSEFPDLYPYFVNIYGLRRGYELISPTDPLQQIAVLMHILEDISIALRYVSFGSAVGPDGNYIHIDDLIGNIVSNWRQLIDQSFIKEYLPRLNDYCQMLEHSTESRTSPYAKRTLNELRWCKRLYFLPYYKFASLGPPPFQKQNISVVYTEIRTLRKYLTTVAAGIEQGNRKGGAAAKAVCDGIDNPWAPYNFEIPNPTSRRMSALLDTPSRNNAALVFFTLSVATVLDYVLNSENSWAYDTSRPDIMFRSVNDEGTTPVFGVDSNINPDQIFKQSLKKAAQK